MKEPERVLAAYSRRVYPLLVAALVEGVNLTAGEEVSSLIETETVYWRWAYC